MGFEIKKIVSTINYLFEQFFINERIREKELQAKLAEIMMSSADSEELKNKIVREIASSLNADRCFFIEYDSLTNNFKKVTNAYSAQRDSKNVLGLDIEKAVPSLAMTQKYMKYFFIKDTVAYIRKNKLRNSVEEKFFEEYDIKASLFVRLEFGDLFLGNLVLHYSKKFPAWQNNGFKILCKLAAQISVALHLTTLYAQEKEEKEKEKLLRAIISVMSTEFNLTQITRKVFEILLKIYGVRQAFININLPDFKKVFEYSSLDSKQGGFFEKEECKEFETIISELPDFDIMKNQVYYINDCRKYIVQNNLENSKIDEYFSKNDIKSFILLPILFEKNSFGVLKIDFSKINMLAKDDIIFLKTITDQLAIAIKQSLSYESAKKQARREILLRAITEKVRSCSDLNETLSFICEQIAGLFNVQRCSIVTFPDINDPESYFIRKEYKVFSELSGMEQMTTVEINELAKYWWNVLVNETPIKVIDNMDDFSENEEFKRIYLSIGIKSIVGVSISKSQELWGNLILSDYKQYRHWSDDEKNLLNTISDQIFIAINQAELYEKEKISTEREKMSKLIVEILRSSLDKITIKRQFVKNIGKFFAADRVFFSEYDSDEKMFLPVEEYSEYLSSPSEKSFIGYDWSQAEAIDCIQPLLEKRELKILCWEDYIRDNRVSQSFIDLYEGANISSSYKLPVLYQEKIMGYFSIEYTNQACHRFGDEDINRIRNMCTQAGIALYHADLYIKAKEALLSKSDFIRNVAQRTQILLTEILNLSIAMSKTEVRCDMHLGHVNHINEGVRKIFELTNEVIAHSKIDDI